MCSPFVEYKGTISASDVEKKRAELEVEANRLVTMGGSVRASDMFHQNCLFQLAASTVKVWSSYFFHFNSPDKDSLFDVFCGEPISHKGLGITGLRSNQPSE